MFWLLEPFDTKSNYRQASETKTNSFIVSSIGLKTLEVRAQTRPKLRVALRDKSVLAKANSSSFSHRRNQYGQMTRPETDALLPWPGAVLAGDLPSSGDCYFCRSSVF